MPASSRPTPGVRARAAPRRARWRLAGLLALALCGFATPPARWLGRRVQFDQSTLGARRPALGLQAGERVLLVSPHLDDETLGAGGLLAHLAARRVPLRVVFLTNGDGSGSTIIALNFRHGRRFSFVESARVRQKEALAALGKLGIAPAQVAFLGYPDGDLQTMWDRWNGAPIRSRFTQLLRVPYKDAPGWGSEFRGANLLRDLEAQMETFAPTRVLSTHGADAHPDHWSADAFARLARQVLAERRKPAAVLGIASGIAHDVEHDVEQDGFVIHHGLFPLPHGNLPQERLNVPTPLLRLGTDWRDFELSDAERAAKGAALEEYRSQLVFTPNYLRAFVRRNEPLGLARDFKTSGAWSDEEQESWALARAPGADLRQIRVQSGAASLQIEVDLAAPPAWNVLYALNIKAIFAGGRVQSRRFEVRQGRFELWIREADSTLKATVRGARNGFRVALGIGGGEKPRRLIIDASTWNGAPQGGGAMLDRTESRALVLD